MAPPNRTRSLPGCCLIFKISSLIFSLISPEFFHSTFSNVFEKTILGKLFNLGASSQLRMVSKLPKVVWHHVPIKLHPQYSENRSFTFPFHHPIHASPTLYLVLQRSHLGTTEPLTKRGEAGFITASVAVHSVMFLVLCITHTTLRSFI